MEGRSASASCFLALSCFSIAFISSCLGFYAGATSFGKDNQHYFLFFSFLIQIIFVFVYDERFGLLRVKSKFLSASAHESFLQSTLDTNLSHADNAVNLLGYALTTMGKYGVKNEIQECIRYSISVLKMNSDQLHIPLELLRQQTAFSAKPDQMNMNSAVHEWLMSHFSRSASICTDANEASWYGSANALSAASSHSLKADVSLSGPHRRRSTRRPSVELLPILPNPLTGRSPTHEGHISPPPPVVPHSLGMGVLFGRPPSDETTKDATLRCGIDLALPFYAEPEERNNIMVRRHFATFL